MPDTEAIKAAAARFLRAWSAATQGDPLPQTHPDVVEAHEATRELMAATETTDLLAAYAVVDDLVHRMH